MLPNKDITHAQGRFVTGKSRLTIFKGGIGAGKTLVLCLVAIAKARAGRTFLLVSFSYPTLRDVCLKTLLELLYDLKIVYTLNRSEMWIKIGNGEILLRSGDMPDRLRGINCHDWGIDEAREFKTREIYDILLGRYRKSEDGQGYIATTTKGKNWVYTLEGNTNTEVITQTTFDNPFLPQSYKDNLKEQYTTKFAMQELYAEIVEMGAGIIDPNWFKLIDPRAYTDAVRFWDLAVSIKTYADFSSGALVSIDEKNDLYINDIKRLKVEYPDLREHIIKTAHEDGRKVIIGVEEAGQQLGFIQDLLREPRLNGFQIKALRPEGDKLNRAMPWASRAESGKVYICRGLWNKPFLEECSEFSADNSHQHDDQIDSVSGAYAVLNKNTTAKFRNAGHWA